MKFHVNLPPSSVPDDWLDRVNPFLPADSPTQPTICEDGTVTPNTYDGPCTGPCCQGDT